VVARKSLDFVTGAISNATAGVSGNTSLPGKRMVQVIQALAGPFTGTTKLLTPESDKLPDLDETGQAKAEKSDLARGDVLAAKDVLDTGGLAGLIPTFKRLHDMGFASVVSGKEKSLHCRYTKPSNFGSALHVVPKLINPGSAGFKCFKEDEHDHRWRSLLGKGGLTPYFNFNAKQSGLEAERTSFNQPDVWVMLNKPPEGMALGGPGDLQFELRQGPHSAELDARIGEEGVFQSGVLRGMNVLARAQVYYHRPGAWQEPPNFFNPYWNARLAPKNVAIKRLASELGLGGLFGQLVADNVWMH